MDKYTKLVLTVIAVALVLLNLQLLFQPAPASAAFGSNPATFGEFRDAEDASTRRDVMDRALLVYEWAD